MPAPTCMYEICFPDVGYGLYHGDDLFTESLPHNPQVWGVYLLTTIDLPLGVSVGVNFVPGNALPAAGVDSRADWVALPLVSDGSDLFSHRD